MSDAFKCEECGELNEGVSDSYIEVYVSRPVSTDTELSLGRSRKEDLCTSCVAALWEDVFGDEGGETDE